MGDFSMTCSISGLGISGSTEGVFDVRDVLAIDWRIMP